MTNPTVRARPLVVLASRETGELRELETALFSAGYRVVSARTEHETLEKVHTHQPDAVVLDSELSDHDYALCRALRADPAISPATPIILMQDRPPTADNRADALRAGAWDLQGSPPDSQELLLRLGVFLQSKLEVDRLTAECLIDRGSGLYNSHGFTQRSAELAALTSRQGVPAACAVFRAAEDLATRATGDRLGRAFKSIGRLSDAIGRTAHTEFAVFAPGTNDWAAARMVRRMRDNITQEVGYVAEYGRRITLRVSYSAALASQKVEPRVLLERARNGLESS